MKNNIPTVFIIFGATGDLIGKKIVPALFNLYEKNKLPQMLRIVGFSRRSLTDSEFKDNVVKMIEIHHSLKQKKDKIEKFINHFSYKKGDFNDFDSYKELAKTLGNIDGEWKVCANKLFYLATPPKYNEEIFKHLKTSGLTIPCGPDEGWTRVIVEKPFGNDLKTAEELDLLLGKLFKEEQIYRIDHYLAKEMLQNILSFRFSNNLLEESWNNKYIEKISIKLWEKAGVEHRGTFYDGLGALRDVGQNHLLQMLALVTMDHPGSFAVEKVRRKRHEILKSLQIPAEANIAKNSIRAQYFDYKKIKGVDPASNKETYFKINAEIDSSRWRGVPITLESGKRMKEQIKEIVIIFKHRTPCLCPSGKHYKNKIVFQMEPDEKIEISFLAKKPGLDMEVVERKFNSTARVKLGKAQYVEEYEKLLLDCVEGNQLLFVSTSEIKQMWRYIDPIISAWQKNLVPLHTYEPDKDLKFELNSSSPKINNKEVGIVGLGKMGSALAEQLINKNWRVVGYNRSADDIVRLEKDGLIPAYTLEELVNKLKTPRAILLNLPAGKPTEDVLFSESGLINLLQTGDYILDFGNSFYKDSIERAKKLAAKGINYVDVGISGGPSGAKYGACLMVGGDKKTFDYFLPFYTEISVPQGVEFFEGVGAGHFVKMIHNGIEYGMMQAIGEGFAMLKKSKYRLKLKNVAAVYNNGSVIESKLVGWLKEAFVQYNEELKEASGKVGRLGEGDWTVKTAKEMGVSIPVIENSLQYRIKTQEQPDYIGKILTVLRSQFGGHDIKNPKVSV